MREVLSGHVDRGQLPGLVTLLSRRGEVHVEAIGTTMLGGSEPMRRDTIFRIASMTKPVTAAAAMVLVEECRLGLDDPVDPLLPELADRVVLRAIDSPLDDTVPAARPITLRDLLTLRFGIGAIMAPPGTYPIQARVEELGLAPGPDLPTHGPDEYMKRIGSLPLFHQPGEQWLYDTGLEVLGVLISRATGHTLEDFFRERLFHPLGMDDTGFRVPPGKLDRLPGSYMRNPETGDLTLYDDPADSRWARPPVFESGSGGLVSTVDDYLAFCQMMLNKGVHRGVRVLSRPSVELMTTDQLTQAQKDSARVFFGENSGWGFGLAVNTRRDDLSCVPGRFGWDGGLGTSAHSDPTEDLVGILMTQRMMDSPQPPGAFVDFWTSAYQAIDD
jgi:CubicO group peptidase (beta-lactamase class C family)